MSSCCSWYTANTRQRATYKLQHIARGINDIPCLSRTYSLVQPFITTFAVRKFDLDLM